MSKMDQSKKANNKLDNNCCICNKKMDKTEFNNPSPYKDNGICCNKCNCKYVIPSRIKNINKIASNV